MACPDNSQNAICVIASGAKQSRFWKQDFHKTVLVLLLRKSEQMDPKKLGKKIKLARVELDLTQTQLAEKISGKQKSISGYETGATLPSIRTLVKIAKVLKKPTSHFLGE